MIKLTLHFAKMTKNQFKYTGYYQQTTTKHKKQQHRLDMVLAWL